MGQTMIGIAGRQYRIQARDGDEARIARLGEELAARAARLTDALGVMPEPQLLVMTALMLADELADARAGNPPPANLSAVAAAPDPALLAGLAAAIARLEALAAD